MHIREEQPKDFSSIRNVTAEAFQTMPYSTQKEAEIIDALRAASALTLSLVAEEGDTVIGHVAFSPVLIDGADCGWYGLGPVSVQPEKQGEGIGRALICEGLKRLKKDGAYGCALVGDPAYYHRFGFKADQRLKLKGVGAEYFQCLLMKGDMPSGEVTFHAAFDV
ncbi:GNAT family N-acetyltransferase [Brucella gallinifaecis]|uniref:GNAT family N-acetyltransferase n=1 Tax=Brucella gallinifaecis TaxID=215590 RepID=UPI002361C83D|nr:N-acetyltransferase [Brucella gallinifaecis]